MKGTFDFLAELSQNNHREWFDKHRAEYEQSHQEMILFADQLLAAMCTHDHIQTPSGKKSLFRIYRDVRFGKDKTPYKTNWGGYFRRATAHLRGGYYYQISPDESFVMGGFFGPNAQDLLHIRNQMALDADPLRNVLNSKDFQSFFGTMEGNQLKTSPRGFEKDHPEVDLLRYKQFIIRHDFTEKEVLSPDFPNIVSHTFQQMRPFLDVMTEYLITDLNGLERV
jgi:uncharacterized protein (TIGR02453 family)